MKTYDELKYIPQAVVANYNRRADDDFIDNPDRNYESAHARAKLRLELLGKMNDEGVGILMGTDAPQLYSVPGFSIHRELPYMQAAGMSNYEILRSGSAVVGEYLKDEDTFGLIKEGHRADMIVLNGNPLEDLTLLEVHEGVMLRGKWMSRAEIDLRLKEIEDYYAGK